eukprot:339431_1
MQDPYSASVTPSGANASSRSLAAAQTPAGAFMNEKLERLLIHIAAQKEITNDMRLDAKHLLSNKGMLTAPILHTMQKGRSLSPSPMLSDLERDTDDEKEDTASPAAGTHRQTGSMVIHAPSGSTVIYPDDLNEIGTIPESDDGSVIEHKEEDIYPVWMDME